LCFAFVLGLGVAGAGRAEAQVFVRNVATLGGPAGFAPVDFGGYTYSSGYSVPYSYYAAWPNWPARGYVGYGANDIFPYYGRPYGHAYDLWTWPYMSESYYGGVLARYYYPPVR
jgi:hypothetical protein